MAGPNFDPGQPLPDELEQTVVSVPLTNPFPNAPGSAQIAGAPSVIDPSQVQAERDAAASAQLAARDQFYATHPGYTPPPAPAGAPVVPPPVNPATGAPAQPAAPAPNPPGGPGEPVIVVPGPVGAHHAARAPGAPAPGAPAAAPGTPPAAPGGVGDLQTSGKAITEAGGEQKAALEAAGKTEQQAAAAEAEERARQATEAAAKEKAQADQRAASEAKVRDLRQKAATEPYHSFWEHQGAAKEVLAGLGILLGSVSYSANHVNQAIGVIDRGIAREFEQQKEKHAQLWKDVDAAMEQGKQLRADQLDDMANFRARQAQTLDAVIAKSKQLGAMSKNRQAVADLGAKNAQLAFERDKAYDEARRLDEAAGETRRHNRAEEGIGRAKVGIEGQRLQMEKGSAEELKVAKAVDSSLARDPVTTDLLKTRAKLEEAKSAIASGNPADIQGAIDAYLRAKSGLGARPQAIKQFQERLGGTMDQLKAWIEEKRTGGLPASMIKRFSDAIEYDRAESNSSLQRGARLHEQALLRSPEYARHPELVKAHIADRFMLDNTSGGGGGTALTGADAQAKAWADAHPQDPRAAAIRKRLGM